MVVEQLIESTLLADMMELVDMPGLGSGDYNIIVGVRVPLSV